LKFEIKPHDKFEGVYIVKLEDGSERLATINYSPGNKVYGETLLEKDRIEYRIWEPYRSKLAAAILKGIKKIHITFGSKVLYLGAASGTTASHVSDIVGNKGIVYCVEFSSRVVRDLITVCEKRRNMIPILGDVRFPKMYRMIVQEVDVIYCDVAQPEQAKLLADNADMFLKNGGAILLAVKARSIDVTKDPKEIFEREINVLEDRGFKVQESINLSPFSEDHSIVSATFHGRD